MKSKDLGVNEAFLGIDPWKMMGNYALSKLQGSGFINDFVNQYKKDLKIHPNLSVDDFIDMYWQKNNWDINNISPAYKKSLDDAKQAVITNPSTQSLVQLGKVVYSIASKLPSSGTSTATTQQSTNQSGVFRSNTTQSGSYGNGQLDPSTSQIIGKIWGIKNTPDEIDDLVNIVANSIFKLYKVAPQTYSQIIMSIVNNGGRPSMPDLNLMAKKQSAKQQSTITKPSVNSTPTVNTTPKASVIKPIPKGPTSGSLSGWQKNATISSNTPVSTPNVPSTTEPNISKTIEPEKTVTEPTKDVISKSNELPTSTDTIKEPSLTDKFPEFDSTKYSEPGEINDVPKQRGRNADFTRGGKGVLDPNNTNAMKDISNKALNKRINARNAVQKQITPKIFRAGIPK